MTFRTKNLPFLMAYAVEKQFKIGQLAMARFSFNPLGDLAAFELLQERADNMRFVTLENGEQYNWDSSPNSIFLPLNISIGYEVIEWRLANGMQGSVETEGGDNQDEYDTVHEALQRNFAYLRERSLREQPVVIYPHGLPTDAYLDAIDEFLEEPFRTEDYEEYLDDLDN